MTRMDIVTAPTPTKLSIGEPWWYNRYSNISWSYLWLISISYLFIVSSLILQFDLYILHLFSIVIVLILPSNYVRWVRNHWYRGYNGRLRHFCGWDELLEECIMNSCDIYLVGLTKQRFELMLWCKERRRYSVSWWVQSRQCPRKKQTISRRQYGMNQQ